jgi:hypothetical protein
MKNEKRIMQLLSGAKQIAREYYSLTGKPLGITGEIAEYEAAKHLRIKLTSARQEGYDAVELHGGKKKRLQIKGRCLQNNCKPGQRLGSIRLEKKWDAVLMVLLDHKFELLEIWEAPRSKIAKALKEPGSRVRNERGALGVLKFKSIGKRRWPM